WYGEAEKNLQQAFDWARKEAPAVIFFDEIDALGRSRMESHEASHRLVSTFLENMDGLEGSEGVVVLAATNRPAAVDASLTRPGGAGVEGALPRHGWPDQPGRAARPRGLRRRALVKRQALLGGLAVAALACSSTTGSPSPAPSASPSAAPAASDWLTYQGGADRRGVGPASPTFGTPKPAWTANVDGALFAQLLVAGNVVVAATENDSVYGFDTKSGRQLWRVHLGEPVAGDSLPCGNISPSGITGTPVIDAATRTVY